MSITADILVTREGHVAIVEMCRPPHNFLEVDFLRRMVQTLEQLDANTQCRALVLSSGVRAFSAGADFGGASESGAGFDPSPFYAQAMKLFRTKKPIVAAVAGSAVGAGMGLALVADFRITCAEARFCANFTRLGFHPGFGMSLTLPRLIGEQKASLLFYTGRRIDGETAVAIGLADELVVQENVKKRAVELAHEIAVSAPLAVETTRETLRLGLADRITEANRRELAIQREQFLTADFGEGVTAMAERREPIFQRC